MLTGLDVLVKDMSVLKQKRVGLLTNPSGVTHDLQQNIDVFIESGVNLVALFSPEHGFGGMVMAGEKITSGIEPHTGLTLHSLYGETRKPTPEMLAELDILLFDLQDVGARFYTYTATLALAMQACAENGVMLLVLDRPNPIRGDIVEGPVMQPAFQSFVGHGLMPIRYGLTIGELAKFYALESDAKNLRLEVLPMQGWRRDTWFDQTGLHWVSPSPNIPHAHTATLYPGMGLAGEGNGYSIGPATQLPFERIGAPWVDAYKLAAVLNKLDMAGVRFRPTVFMPTAKQYVYANETCPGVQVHVTDRNSLRAVTLGLHILTTLRALYPDRWEWKASHFDRLIGNDTTRAQIDSGLPVADIVASWQAEQAAFLERARSCFLYS